MPASKYLKILAMDAPRHPVAHGNRPLCASATRGQSGLNAPASHWEGLNAGRYGGKQSEHLCMP